MTKSLERKVEEAEEPCIDWRSYYRIERLEEVFGLKKVTKTEQANYGWDGTLIYTRSLEVYGFTLDGNDYRLSFYHNGVGATRKQIMEKLKVQSPRELRPKGN